MAVDVLRGALVLGLELRLDVRGRRVELLRSCEFRETDGQGALLDLGSKKISFVQEENDRSVGEPFIVTDRIKQLQGFLHTVRGLVLVQHLVVFAHGHAEDDCRHILEAVNPFLPLRPLPAHVEKLEVEVLEGEVDLHNTGGLHSSAEDVLLSGLIVPRAQPVQVVQEIFGGVVELVLVTPPEAQLHPVVAPEALHGHQQFLAERLRVLHAADHIEDHARVRLPVPPGEADGQVRHGPQDGHQRLDGVGVHHRPVLLVVLRGEALLVNDLHLLDDGALPRLSGAKQQQLDVLSGLDAVLLEVALDLLAASLSCPLLGRHGAPHGRTTLHPRNGDPSTPALRTGFRREDRPL